MRGRLGGEAAGELGDGQGQGEDVLFAQEALLVAAQRGVDKGPMPV